MNLQQISLSCYNGPRCGVFLTAPLWQSLSPLFWGLSSLCNIGKFITHHFLKYLFFSYTLSLTPQDLLLSRCQRFYFHPPFCWTLFYIFHTFLPSWSLLEPSVLASSSLVLLQLYPSCYLCHPQYLPRRLSFKLLLLSLHFLWIIGFAL